MTELIQISTLAILAALLACTMKKTSAEHALLLSLSACVLICLFLLGFLRPILTFLTRLQSMTGLDNGFLTPVLKVVAIGFLSQIASTICADAGQSSLAKLIELSGGILALYVSLPLFEAVLELMQRMGSG